MHGVTLRLVWMAAMAVAMLAGACSASGVGDPCIPESIPCSDDGTDCGFDSTESYVEASSVQCRTRACLVHRLEGNPAEICQTGNEPPGTCLPLEAVDERVFCSCRCDAPDSVKARTKFDFCDCPSGFSCEEVLSKGNDGIVGSYCVDNRVAAGN